MTIVGRLTSIGTFFAYDYDETVVTKFRVDSNGTAYSTEFDENTATTLSGNSRMRGLSDGGLIVLDSIDEIDPFDTLPTSGLQLYIDPGISTTRTETAPVGQQSYTSAGTYTFTVPTGCTSISAVCIGGGGGGAGADNQLRNSSNNGGGGGGLAYGTIAVTPGEQLTVVVGSGGNAGNAGDGGAGGNTTISRGLTTLLSGGGGGGGGFRNANTGSSGSSGGTARTGGGSGGSGGTGSDTTSSASGGGGAGGYSGNGGAGGAFNAAGSSGAGGGGGGGAGYSTASTTLRAGGGGGVGILGSGSNGAGGTGTTGNGGGGGSSGTNGGGNTTGTGGQYGGGGGGHADNSSGSNTSGGAGTGGAVRIIWGSGRSYPSTSVADAATVNYALTLNDLSGNSRNATSVNGAYYTGSLGGGVVSLDGVDDYMTVSAYKGITGTGARTTIIWFEIDSNSATQRLVGWGNTSTGGKWNISLDTTTFLARVEIGTGSVAENTTEPAVSDTKFHMVAASVPASGTANDIKLYVDGQLITNTTITSGATAVNTASGSDVSFGASLADVTPGYIVGNVSQVLIYNRQLSDLEIKIAHRAILNRFYT